LHKNEAIRALRLTSPINPIIPQKTDIAICELLVVDPNFLLYRWTFDQPIEVNAGNYCSIWTVFSGAVQIGQETLNRGDSILIPATQKTIQWLPLINPNKKNNKVILGECTTNDSPKNSPNFNNTQMFDKNRFIP
jgi:hypothetical protein